MQTQETYNDGVIRLFLYAAIVWALIGMSVGVCVAAELYWPNLNMDIPALSFSRLRPSHTFGVIFAFGVSALIGTSFYVAQRTGHTRLAFGKLAYFVLDRKSTRLNSSHVRISYAVFCLKK